MKFSWTPLLVMTIKKHLRALLKLSIFRDELMMRDMLAFVRVFLVFIWVIFCTLVGGAFALVRFRNPTNVHYIARALGFVGSKLVGIRLIQRNYDYLVGKNPMIILGNHQHSLDVFTLGTMTPPGAVSIGKREILWIPFFGVLYYLSGNILINRQNTEEAKGTLQAAQDTMKRKKISVWLFPEGTRRYGIGLGPFKKGSFHMAINSQLPIYPVVASPLKGNIDLNRWHTGTVIVEALPSISTLGLRPENVDELLDRVHREMSQAIARLDQEVKEQNSVGTRDSSH
jgi:1-acyl-sn-glycerol-3-phosphate acyltransferase